jgi:ribosome biogenesis GTPase / thiamine phosphate phosphatase
MAEPQVARVAGPSATLLVDGATREARIAPRLPDGPPVAGDRVVLREEGDELVVTGILPRATTLQRGGGPAGRPRMIVANAELLAVVASVAEPPLRPRLVDRYLVAAWAGGLDAALVLTKLDKEHDAAEVERVAGRYRAIGYPVLAGSAKDPELVEAVRDLIGRRVAALAGHSGVGKSTLTRGLTGVERAVGSVSRKAGTGRHTTTDPRLIPLPGGGGVVDTAGVRTFFLPRLDPEELEAGFPEIAAAAPDCRFRGCRHRGEPGCVVEERVSPERLDSYRRLLADAT